MRYFLTAVTAALAITGCQKSPAGASSLDASETPAAAAAAPSESLFVSTAKGIVACYEAVGEAIPRTFDESGACEPGGDLATTSIWKRQSKNPTIAAAGFQVRDDEIKEYEGRVSFVDAKNRSCAFELDVEATGEDATAKLDSSRITCQELVQLPKGGLEIAKAIANTLGHEVDARCVSDNSDASSESKDFLVQFWDAESAECTDPHFSLSLSFDADGQFLKASLNDA